MQTVALVMIFGMTIGILLGALSAPFAVAMFAYSGLGLVLGAGVGLAVMYFVDRKREWREN